MPTKEWNVSEKTYLPVLEALNTYYVLTSDELLIILGKTIRTVQLILKWLVKNHYIYAYQRYESGRQAYFYFLLDRGVATLEKAGKEVKSRTTEPQRLARLNATTLLHTLTANRLVLALKQIEVPGKLKLLWYCHEYRMKDYFHEKNMGVPDGYVKLKYLGNACHAFIEIENTTANEKDWKARVRRYIDLFQTRHDPFVMDRAVVIVLTMEEKAEKLKQWTEEVFRTQELEEHRAWEYPRRFHITVSDETLAPQDFYTLPRWQTPFEPDHPLLTL